MEEIQVTKQTIFLEASAAPQRWMQTQGYAPEPTLMHVKGAQGMLMHGYEIPHAQLDALVKELDAQTIAYELPTLALLPVKATKGTQLELAQLKLPATQLKVLGRSLGHFLDLASTASARATFYNTREAQEQAALQAHEMLMAHDRGLYGAMLTLPGTNDYNRQLGLKLLLEHPRHQDVAALLDEKMELQLLQWLLANMPPTRMLKFFIKLREARVNNARTRKLILRSILSNGRLELWSTRYRRKLRASLEHAWGKRTTGILRSVLRREESARSKKEERLLYTHITKHAGRQKPAKVCECVAFILGIEENLKLPKLRAYHAAKDDLDAGRILPFETLEGIRSCYHKERDPKDVLELTKKQMTQGQRMTLQRKAEEKGVEIQMDVTRYEPTKLYIYSYAQGMNDEIAAALQQKAQEAARQFPFQFGHIGILFDASASMQGTQTQALRPMATALATRDMLKAASEKASVLYCGGTIEEGERLVHPQGETSLAKGLISLLKEEPDAVFILSDGYENAPAGRLAEVIEQVRRLGIATPIYQFSPVSGAEAGGVRALAQAQVPAMPIAKPSQMGLPLLKGMLQHEPHKAIEGLLGMANKVLKEIQESQQLAAGTRDETKAKSAPEVTSEKAVAAAG